MHSRAAGVLTAVNAAAPRGLRLEPYPDGEPAMTTTREQYVEKLKGQLDKWNADVAKWEAQAKSAREDMKKRYADELTALRARREEALYNLKLLEGASSTAWQELSRGADEAWERMRAAVAKARTNFEKQ